MDMIERLARVVKRLQEETGMPVTVDLDEDYHLFLVIDCGENMFERLRDIDERWWLMEGIGLPGVVLDCHTRCEQGAYLGDPDERR